MCYLGEFLNSLENLPTIAVLRFWIFDQISWVYQILFLYHAAGAILVEFMLHRAEIAIPRQAYKLRNSSISISEDFTERVRSC